MGIVVDLAFILFATVTMPFWLISMWMRGRLRTDWPARLGWRLPQIPRSGSGGSTAPRILIHAVSVGEVNAIRLLADTLADGPLGAQVVISVTTDTGIARAREVLGAKHIVVRFPFDLSWIMRRFLDRVQPDAVLLTELELWPNFTHICAKRGIPMAVVNGRLSARSFARSMHFKWILSPMFRRLWQVGAQDKTYADRFAAMGVDRQRITVTGTMKWDTAQISDFVEGADALASEMGIDRTKPLIVAGSTAPGEELLLHRACPSGAQLLCAPRKPEWFSQAAHAMPGCVTRSAGKAGSSTGRFVLDTIGELRKAYALADLVVIGRSFGNLYGSDMMEPAGLGKAVVVGPRVGDFQSTVDALIKSGGLVQTTADELPRVLSELLADSNRRRDIAIAARQVIRSEQGATQRHALMAQSMLEQAALAKRTPTKERNL